MPIPQLSKNKKHSQVWRNDNKKYYINRKTPKSKSFFNRKRKHFITLNLKNKIDFTSLKKKVLIFFGLLCLVGIMALIIIFSWISRNLPDPNQLIDREVAESTQIFDRTGEISLYEIHGNEKRTLVNINDLPDYVKQATIAIEDKDFYNHGGISFWGIFRGTIWQVVRGKKAQGGSTLTQQFIKNTILTNERSIKRKIKEWLLAYKVEQKFSKDEILQMYFNEIPYGSTAYGVEAASQRFFGKNAKDINIAEAAILAALPQAPSRYSPYGQNKDLLLERQQYIIGLMVEQNYISKNEAEEAKSFELEFKKPGTNIKAPHFVMLIKEILSEKYGEKVVEQGGLKITTTLDMYKQEIAEEVVAEVTENYQEKYNASNASLVSLDPKTGQVLAMVGSRDYFNDEIDGQVNITTSLRQPGSSMKPLVYASTFINGYTPDTVLYDVVTNFSNNKDEPYEPHNYDSKEHGPVTIRKALAGSLNIPAVKAIYLVGINNVLDLAKDLGYTTLADKNRYGLSFVLGGGEVKMIEHVNAYGSFAREGILHPINMILKIEDRGGNILEEFKNNERKVLNPKVARTLNNVLSDNNARAYAFGENNYLTLNTRPVAAKTGTTNDYRDAWTIGYTPSLVTGVWVGNNDNSKMKKGAAGGVVAAPIWNSYMKRVLGNTPIETFKDVEIEKTGKAMLDGESGMETKIKIDISTGLLATQHTPEEFIEEKIFIQAHSILYYVDKNNPLGPIPTNPEKDPQFDLWETGIHKWLEKQELSTTTPPTEYDNIHIPENKPILNIISPENNQIIKNPLLKSEIEATAPRGIYKANYYINNNLFFTNTNPPFSMEKRIDFLSNGFHKLKVEACDDVNNCSYKEVEFNLILEERKDIITTSIDLIYPTSGLAISNIDFPLNINLKNNNPGAIAKINIYIKNETGKTILIKSITPVNWPTTNYIWNTIPESGTYKLYAEVKEWSDKTIKTDENILIINNTNKVETIELSEE